MTRECGISFFLSVSLANMQSVRLHAGLAFQYLHNPRIMHEPGIRLLLFPLQSYSIAKEYSLYEQNTSNIIVLYNLFIGSTG